MTVYYNEIDKYAAEWLCNLIAEGVIAPGVVDTRSIEDVQPNDLRGFAQCHFFAGIGIWSLALRRAGWRDDRSIWTCSAPCQPYSAAGQGAGFADERHLWPHFHHLAKERRPSSIVGEQVASGHADAWLDLVQDDLEGLGYAFGAVAFPSAGVGAPHSRDRTYWMANADGTRSAARLPAARYREERNTGILNDSSRECRWPPGAPGAIPTGATNGYWSDADWLNCRDGKYRPVEPGTFPLVDGDTSRVGRLRAYGNAINAEAARVFIQAMMETI